MNRLVKEREQYIYIEFNFTHLHVDGNKGHVELKVSSMNSMAL